jgi:hypothetical protein
MFSVLTVLFIIFAYFVHECLGHAAAMKKAGVSVTKLIFGLPYGPSFSFPLRGKWSGTEFVVYYLLPFGAFTVCDTDAILELPYWQQSRICAAGPIASILFGSSLYVLASFVVMAERGIALNQDLTLFILSILGSFALLCILRFGGKIFFTYIAPMVPIALLIYLGYGLLLGNGANVTDVVEVARGAGKVNDFTHVLCYAAGFSIDWFGVTMLLPLKIFGLPLDGQQIVRLFLEKFTPSAVDVFESLGTLIFGFIILFVLQTELKTLLLYLHR